MHHAAVLNIPVIFVVATKHDIVYVAKVNVDAAIRNELIETFKLITMRYMICVTEPNITVPRFPSKVFGERMDHRSLQNYVNLAASFHKKVEVDGVMPVAQYSKPRLVAMWKSNKGGTNVMPHVLKSAPFKMTSIYSKHRQFGVLLR